MAMISNEVLTFTESDPLIILSVLTTYTTMPMPMLMPMHADAYSVLGHHCCATQLGVHARAEREPPIRILVTIKEKTCLLRLAVLLMPVTARRLGIRNGVQIETLHGSSK
mmetsp:Transcript_3356/g.4506  ORF Transcript_3356/g.4506 Transcript_3356/m.4506 type:complete len:110 (-) Transcript_3356:4-333(-)